MISLSSSAAAKARDYVDTQARKVDSLYLTGAMGLLRWAEFEDALTAFQNEDGGFGHAIEPDFRVPASSVTATTVAFQYLQALEVPNSANLVRRGIDYLLATYNQQSRSWPPVCEEITRYPRASWWNYCPPISYNADEPNWANPNIEVIGILNTYADQVDPRFLADLNKDALGWLGANETVEPHGLMCAMRYAGTLDGPLREQAKGHLAPMVLKQVKTDPAEWAKYQPQPVWFVRHPEDLLADVFGDTLFQNLDFLISQQQSDGSWPVTWEWDRFPETWPEAKKEWTGVLTAKNLKLLQDFGRCRI